MLQKLLLVQILFVLFGFARIVSWDAAQHFDLSAESLGCGSAIFNDRSHLFLLLIRIIRIDYFRSRRSGYKLYWALLVLGVASSGER